MVMELVDDDNSIEIDIEAYRVYLFDSLIFICGKYGIHFNDRQYEKVYEELKERDIFNTSRKRKRKIKRT